MSQEDLKNEQSNSEVTVNESSLIKTFDPVWQKEIDQLIARESFSDLTEVKSFSLNIQQNEYTIFSKTGEIEKVIAKNAQEATQLTKIKEIKKILYTSNINSIVLSKEFLKS